MDLTQRRLSRSRILCELLAETGFLQADQIPDLLNTIRESDRSFDEILAGALATTEIEVAKSLALAVRFPFIDIEVVAPDEDAVQLLSPNIAHAHCILPLRRDGRRLVAVTSDPIDLEAESALRMATGGMQIRWEVAAESSLRKAIETHYGTAVAPARSEMNRLEAASERAEILVIDPAEEQYTLAEMTELAQDLSATRVLNTLYGDAVTRGSSDIHIEPNEQSVQVRFRIDGQLRLIAELPKAIQPPLISRAKLLGEMDIAESRKPQDGRCRLLIDRRRVDLRISSLPTIHGEKLVIRILDPSKGVPTLEELGFLPHDAERLNRLLSLPQGMILVTGPTGSGKSTTLYSCLNRLTQEKTNIVTVEDPVEREMPGVNQVPVHSVGGVTFASALRSILRQDPNVIMVGEIRDQETGEIAFRASLTGHLVLSTLHTLDAPSAVTRCLDLGLDPSLVASALSGVVAQRLVRRNCPECVVKGADGNYRGAGCKSCEGTGYKGRVGTYELLEVDERFQELLATGGSVGQLREAAKASGMRTLWEDARAKLEAGWYRPEEVADVVPPDLPHAGAAMPPGVSQADPTNAVSAPAPTDAGSRAAESTPPASGDPGESYFEGRILVVEDDEMTRQVIQRILEKGLYQVYLAEDGAEGLQKALKELPDVILTDVMMPEMEGYELCKRVKNHPRTRHIPVVMLTTEMEVDSEVRGIEAGADDYIPKPVEPKRLRARLSLIMRRVRAAA